jgi:hypothetical protein
MLPGVRTKGRTYPKVNLNRTPNLLFHCKYPDIGELIASVIRCICTNVWAVY